MHYACKLTDTIYLKIQLTNALWHYTGFYSAITLYGIFKKLPTGQSSASINKPVFKPNLLHKGNPSSRQRQKAKGDETRAAASPAYTGARGGW